MSCEVNTCIMLIVFCHAVKALNHYHFLDQGGYIFALVCFLVGLSVSRSYG